MDQGLPDSRRDLRQEEGRVKGTVEEILAGQRDALTVRRVFGEPYQQNGVTIVPAATVVGGGGGGEGEDPDGSGRGWGTGFGLVGRPAGVFVIRGDDVKWQPAVDVNRMVGGVLAFAALRLLLRRRRKS